jgi:alpha-D-ribose 1-methylphosphonate 5-triphosphate synthase subunit PhnH
VSGEVTAPDGARLAPVAEWPMLRELDSETAQRVFHAAMDAFARPGTIHRLPEAAVPAPVPAVLAPLLALADIMTPIAALPSRATGDATGDATGSTAGAIAPSTATYAATETGTAAAVAVAARLVNTRIVAPAEARFALALGEPEGLSELNRGSHWSPEGGAMLFQRVAGLTSGTSADAGAWRLTGPGIKPGAPVLLRVAGLGERFLAERAERVSDYPAGIDVLLVTDEGEIAALSRTTRIETVDAAPPAPAAANGAI